MESPFAHRSELVQHYNQRYANLRSRINHLSQQLQGFTVVTSQGQPLGRITDIILDAGHRPSLVIETDDRTATQTLTLDTGSIRRVDVKLRVIQVEDGHTFSQELSPPTGHPSRHVQQEQGTLKQMADDIVTTDYDAATEPQAEPVILRNTDTGESIRIPLLEERLRIDYQRRKVGEVVLRKQVETRMVTVPVRYERLIVEQVSPEHKQLADIQLPHSNLPSLAEISKTTGHNIVGGEFGTPGVASQILNTIAQHFPHQCQKVRIEIELADANLKDTFQRWLNQDN